MDTISASKWETVMVNLIADIFVKKHIEFNNRNYCWSKQTLSEIPPFQEVMPNVPEYNLEVASKWRTVAKGVEYCAKLKLLKNVYIKMKRLINDSWAGYSGVLSAPMD